SRFDTNEVDAVGEGAPGVQRARARDHRGDLRHGFIGRIRVVPQDGEDLFPDGIELGALELAGRQFVAAGTAARTTDRHCAVQFAETPRGLTETLTVLERDDRRAAQRVDLAATVRIRRQSGPMEVVPIGDISQAGFYFESTQFYSIGEKVFAILRYNPDSPDEAMPEVPAVIARASALHTWGAFSYGVHFISVES
ncbi:MAG: PilZ domain-containing protein, partial [Gammaproteobacteria bacterium]